jgi:predicted nucleic acid-binding protein
LAVINSSTAVWTSTVVDGQLNGGVLEGPEPLADDRQSERIGAEERIDPVDERLRSAGSGPRRVHDPFEKLREQRPGPADVRFVHPPTLML